MQTVQYFLSHHICHTSILTSPFCGNRNANAMTQGPQSNPMRTNGRRYSSLPVWGRIITSSHRGNSADAGLDRPLYLRNILYDKTLKSQNYYSNNYNITYKLKHLRLQLIRNKIEGPSGGSRAAAAVADGCREVAVVSSSVPGGWSRSACIPAMTIPVAELVDTWPPISSGSAWPLGYLRAETPTWEGPTDPNAPWLPKVGESWSLMNKLF